MFVIAGNLFVTVIVLTECTVTTVKPVYNDHPWDQEKVVVVQRWSLFRGSNCEID